MKYQFLHVRKPNPNSTQWHYFSQILIQIELIGQIFGAGTGFELTDRESRFAIHFNYFIKHFLLIFMKFVDQFLKAQL